MGLEIRICGSVAREYRNSGKCSFVVFQGAGGVKRLSWPLVKQLAVDMDWTLLVAL